MFADTVSEAKMVEKITDAVVKALEPPMSGNRITYDGPLRADCSACHPSPG